jgi:hypothetical protein
MHVNSIRLSDFIFHIHYIDDEYPKIKAFIEALEARKLRLFHRELNICSADPCCMEFAFIRLDWTIWNLETKFELTPVK